MKIRKEFWEDIRESSWVIWIFIHLLTGIHDSFERNLIWLKYKFSPETFLYAGSLTAFWHRLYSAEVKRAKLLIAGEIISGFFFRSSDARRQFATSNRYDIIEASYLSINAPPTQLSTDVYTRKHANITVPNTGQELHKRVRDSG